MLNILHVCPTLDLRYGGPANAVKDIASWGANEKMLKISLATLQVSDDNLNLVQWLDPRVEVYQFDAFANNKMFFSLTFNNWINKNIHQYDLVHVHVPFTGVSHSACHAALRYQIPYVISTHGTLSSWALSQKKFKKLLYLKLFGERILAGAAVIHVTSKIEKNSFQFNNENISVVPLPIGVRNNFPDVPMSDGLIYEKPLNVVRLVCVARLHEVKCIPDLILVVRALINLGVQVHLEIIGSGANSYERFLLSLVDKYCLKNYITFSGHMQPEAVYERLQLSDIFILLSKHENFSVAAAEALSCGLPVIVTDTVGISDYISEFSAGLVVKFGNINAAVDAVIQVIERRPRSYRSNSHKLVLEKFSPNHVSKQFLSLYRNIVG